MVEKSRNRSLRPSGGTNRTGTMRKNASRYFAGTGVGGGIPTRREDRVEEENEDEEEEEGEEDEEEGDEEEGRKNGTNKKSEQKRTSKERTGLTGYTNCQRDEIACSPARFTLKGWKNCPPWSEFDRCSRYISTGFPGSMLSDYASRTNYWKLLVGRWIVKGSGDYLAMKAVEKVLRQL